MKKAIFFSLILILLPLFPTLAEQNYSEIKAFNPYTQEVEKNFNFPYENYHFDIAAIDLGGDGTAEYAVANGQGQKPYITLFDKDGGQINRFLARFEDYNSGLLVATGDLNNDGHGEIITSGFAGKEPNIKIFDGYGRPIYNLGFYPYGQDYKGSVSIATFDVNGDGNLEIVTGTGPGSKPEVKVFNRYGQNMGIDFFPLNFSESAGINVSGIDLGGDGIGEILISTQKGYKSQVAIYRTDGSLIREFLAFNEKFLGGVNITNYDINNDAKDEILLSAGFGAGPHVRVMNGYGQDLVDFYAYNQTNISGVKITKGDINNDGIEEIIASPERAPEKPENLEKYIDIDISEQKFRYYQQGFLIGDLITSTGKPSTPTRLGEFKVLSKYPVAYGGITGQSWKMPFFIGFYMSGSLENGIHELPFINGWREGAWDLGYAVSHGCVRLGIGPAKEVYDWVEVGDKVIVHK